MDALTERGHSSRTRSNGAGDPSSLPTEPFRVESLKALLEDRRVIRSGKPPSAAGLQHLVRDLNGLCKLVRLTTGPWRASDERATRITDAVRTLVRDLPAHCDGLREELRAWIGSRGGPDLGELQLRVAHRTLTDLLAAAEAVRRYSTLVLVPLSQVMDPAERWQYLAPSLSKSFTRAMHTTNPAFTFGASDKSPGPRFIAAVMPLITGETPSEDAIAQFFKRRRKKSGT